MAERSERFVSIGMIVNLPMAQQQLILTIMAYLSGKILAYGCKVNRKATCNYAP